MTKTTPLKSHGRDMRAVLHYVPQFIGCVFFVELEWSRLPQPAKAELMMDLRALQTIGVKLAITVEHSGCADLIEWGVELELKMAQPHLSFPSDLNRAEDIIARGQACIIDRGTHPCLSEEAIALARYLNAAKLISLTSTTSDPVKPAGAIALSQARTLQTNPSSSLDHAIIACEQGIDRVHLLDARTPGVLLDELFSNEGVGTMIHKDSYQKIRPLREEDIPELLGMIGRSVRNTALVPRNYEEIHSKLSDYYVMCIDSHVVGSIALHPYDHGKQAELACLYVKHTHESRGYGTTLVQHALTMAPQLGYQRIFALTNRAATFFTKLGFTESNSLPAYRQQQLEQSGRNSAIYAKTLNNA